MKNQLITIYIAYKLRRGINRSIGRKLSAMSQSNKISLNNSIDEIQLTVALAMVALLPGLFIAIDYFINYQ